MSTIVLTVNSNTYDAEDRRGAKQAIAERNQFIADYNNRLPAVNAQRAANIPALPALPAMAVLPSSTAAEIKASYEPILAQRAADIHATYVRTATEQQATTATEFQALKGPYVDAPPAKQAAAIAAFNAALD